MKKFIKLFLVLAVAALMCVGVFAADNTSRGIEYTINSITVKSASSYQVLDGIPDGKFIAEVSVTNNSSTHTDDIILATYDENGRMLDMTYMYSSIDIGKTVSMGTLIKNEDGAVASIKAFVWANLSGIPLAKEAVYDEDGFDIVRTSTMFIITATPKQAYAAGYNSSSANGTYVGIQPLVNSIASGEVLYVPVEKLGIDADEVENYLHYSVELIDYDAATGKFREAILGNDPHKVYTEDVSFERDKNGDLVPGNTKIIINGTTYNLVDSATGTVLKNELVAFAGADVNTYQAKVLFQVGDSVLSSEGGTVVATYIGVIGNTKYYAAHIDVEWLGIAAGTVISEAQALEAWGVATTDSAYTKYSTLTVPHIDALNAYELALFDDDNNGKYDRAIVNKVYVSAYGTFKSDVDVDENGKKDDTCDSIATAYAYEDVLAANVTYSDASVMKAGTVFTFTYNPATKTVHVIEKIPMQTAKLNTVDATDKFNGNYVVTLGTDVYTAKLNSANGNIGAVALEYGQNTSAFAGITTIASGKQYMAMPNANVTALNAAANLGVEYNYYAIGDCILWIEPVAEVATYADFIVLDQITAFELGELYFNAYVDGELKEIKVVEFEGQIFSEMSDWKFSQWLDYADNAGKLEQGTVYAVENTADYVNVLGVLDSTTYADYVIDANNGMEYHLNHIGYGNTTIVDSDGVITFEDGVTRYLAADASVIVPAKRLRTNADTVFYFINKTYNASGGVVSAEIETFVDSPEEATITLDSNTHIYVDWLGYKENTANAYSAPTASLVIVIDPADFDGFEADIPTAPTAYTGVLIGDLTNVALGYASDFGLEGYPENIEFYQYNDAVIDLDCGEYVTVYSPVELTQGKIICEFDANGVIVDYDELDGGNFGYTFAEAIDAGILTDYSYTTVSADFDFDTKVYDLTSTSEDGTETVICDTVSSITAINIGNAITLKSSTGVYDDIYGTYSRTTAWDEICNLFDGTGTTYNDINDAPEKFYILSDSLDDGELVVLYSFVPGYPDVAILDEVVSCGGGKLVINAYINGYRKEIAVTEFEGVDLAGLTAWNLNQWAQVVNNHGKLASGTIYAIENTADGVNVLGIINKSTYQDYNIVNNGDGTMSAFERIGLSYNNNIADSEGVITFENGVTRFLAAEGISINYRNRLRTNGKTVFYFVDRTYDASGAVSRADIKVYVGAPEDATITLDSGSAIYVDRIGYSNSSSAVASHIIVIDYADYDGFGFETPVETIGLFMPSADVTETAGFASHFGLEGYDNDIAFHKYTNAIIDLDSGEYVTVYSPVALREGRVYEFDANGVILGYDDLVKEDWTEAKYGKYEYTLAEATLAGMLDDFSGQKFAIGYDYNGAKNYHVTSGGTVICDRDGFKIGNNREGIVNKVVIVNIGNDYCYTTGGGSAATAKAGSISTAWNVAVDVLNGEIPYDCYILSNSINDGTLVILYAFN